MAKRKPWVTDPDALRTVLALNELCVGDEIKVEVCTKNPIHRGAYDYKYLRHILVVDHFDDDAEYPINTRRRSDGDTYCWCPCGIVAWRRPSKPTG